MVTSLGPKQPLATIDLGRSPQRHLVFPLKRELGIHFHIVLAAKKAPNPRQIAVVRHLANSARFSLGT
jgi:hypothetical protein